MYRGDSRADAGPDRHPAIEKRASNDGSVDMRLYNEQSFYRADLYIGSKQEKVGVLVDTGSSDLWVMPPDVQCGVAQNKKRAYYDDLDEEVATVKREVATRDEVATVKRDVATVKREESVATVKRDATREASVATVKREVAMKEAPAATRQLEEPSVASIESVTGTPTEPFVNRDCQGLFCAFSTIIVTGSMPTNVVPGGSGETGSPSQETDTCTLYGSFATGDSSSWNANSSAPAFFIQYADGTSAHGQWGQDTVLFAGTNVTDLSLAVVNKSDSAFGVLGIGLPGLEATFNSLLSSSSYTYENLPLRMKALGIIDKVVYSLALGPKNSKSGSLLFGAVDKAKYSGQLQTVPIVNLYDGIYKNPVRLDIKLDGLSFESSSQNESVSSTSVAALLDSGTTLTYMPSSMLRRLGQLFSGSYSNSYGMYRISCNFNTNSAYLVYNFSGIKIRVPLSDLVVSGGPNTCYLGIMEQPSKVRGRDYITLGDNFLRSAYVVYDLEDYTISLAQASHSNQEDISEVLSLIPNAVSAAGYSSTALALSSSSDGDDLSISAVSSNGMKKSAGVKSYRLPWSVLAGVLAAGLLVWF